MILHSIASVPFRQPILVKMLFSRKRISSDIFFVNIDPVKIKYFSYIPRSSPVLMGPKAYTGVYQGIWDKLIYPFEKNVIYGLANVIISGGNIENSLEYRYIKKRISKQRADWEVQKLVSFVDKFSNEGYLSQYELKQIKRTRVLSAFNIPNDETTIGLDRNGDYIRLIGGRHRLAIAQQMKITEMPAILTLIHGKNLTTLPEKCRLITGDEEDFRTF